ncbi:membrane hypothetical protein [Rhodospirillaceae bacterium LM-1]|nr:membrane hypothetical protein [Rhodospirillaceae bacterium LM-1]
MRAASATPFGKIVLAAGLAIYLFTILVDTAHIMSLREMPAEVDDSINYILRSVQLESCVLQECKALDDLLRQIAQPADQPELDFNKRNEFARVFPQHMPLYSALLLAVKSLGFSWGGAYQSISVVGAIFLGVAASLWIGALWGNAAAGFAMVYLGLFRFADHGLDRIVPSSLALALGLLSWWMIVKLRERPGVWLPVMLFATVAMHRSGALYGAAALAAAIMIWPRPWSARAKVTLFAAFAVLGAIAALPYVIPHPAFSFPSLWSGKSTSLIDVFFENLVTVTDTSQGLWMLSWGNKWLFAALVGAGILLVDRSERRQALLFLLPVLGIVVVTLVYPNGRPGELFTLSFVPLTMWLIGAIGGLAVRGAVSLWSGARLLHRPWKAGDLAGLAGLAILLVCAPVYVKNARSARIDRVGNQIVRHDFRFDVSQSKRFVAPGACRVIVYNEEVSMHHYLAHGAMGCGAVFLPILQKPDAAVWLKDLGQAGDYAVAAHPLALHRNRISLQAESSITLQLADKPDKDVRVKLENLSSLPTKMRAHARGQEWTLELAPEWMGWVDVPARLAASKDVWNLEGDPDLYLTGIRIGNDLSLEWPWDQGVKLGYQETWPRKRRREIDFASSRLIDINLKLDIVADGGLSVLAAITAHPP